MFPFLQGLSDQLLWDSKKGPHTTKQKCRQRDRENIYSAAGTQSGRWRGPSSVEAERALEGTAC